MSASPDRRTAASDPGHGSQSGLETMTRELMHASRYHAWMFSQIEDFVGSRVLEVGAGSGNLTQFLTSRAEVTALDASRTALDVAVDRLGICGLDTVVADITDPIATAELKSRKFDTIVSSNVIEHIQHDHLALSNMHEILRSTRGHVLLIVPAHQRLFGSLDRAAGHYRRYSRSALTAKLRATGFLVHRARYVNILGAIAWYINGSILQTDDLNARSVNVQANLFDRIAVPGLRRLESIVDPPFGQSLVVVGQAC